MKQYPFPRQKAQLHYAVEYTSEFRANIDLEFPIKKNKPKQQRN